MTSAINIFVKQSLRKWRIPFEPSLVPNTETLEAMLEAEEIVKSGATKYSNFTDMLEELKKNAGGTNI